MLTINGQKVEHVDDVTLASYLAQEGYASTRVAVECNGEMIPKAKYEQKILEDGDVLEIVHFVGGG